VRRFALLVVLAVVPFVAPASAPGLDNNGELKILVILATWGPQPFTREQAQQAVFDRGNPFVQENSYGKAHLAGEVTDWLKPFSSPPACGTPAEQRSLATAAQAAAKAAGFAVDSYSRFVYAFPFEDACGYLGYGSLREVYLNGPQAITTRIATHELGHTFGLEHAHLHSCSAAGCVEVEYGDPYDTMGSGVGDYNAYEKFVAGWLGNVIQPERTGDYTIDDIETASAQPQAIEVQTAHADYWLDHREPVGADAAYAGLPIVQGVEIHGGPPSADPTAASEFSFPNSLLPNPGGRGIPALLVGDTLTDPGAFRATVTAHIGTTVTVHFEWTDTIPPSKPSISVPKKGKRNRTISVGWGPSNDSGSGVGHYDVTFDGRLVKHVLADFKLPTQAGVRTSRAGRHVVRVVAVDRAGNRSKAASATIVVR
jgi:hypothetical protein